MLGQCPSDELQRVGRVHLLVMDDRRQRIGRVHRRDAVEAVGALGVVGRVVDGIDRELHVGRGVRHAVVPLHVRAQLPRHVHAAVGTQPDAAVGERRHLARQHRHHVHVLIGDGQPFDDARLDVLEDVRAEAIQRIGLAVVADDQQVVRWQRGDRAPGARKIEEQPCQGNRKKRLPPQGLRDPVELLRSCGGDPFVGVAWNRFMPPPA